MSVSMMGAIEALDQLLGPPGRPWTAEDEYRSQLSRFWHSWTWGTGYVWCPGDWEAGEWEVGVSITHAEHTATTAYWDAPGRLPWLIVSQTPCPGGDLWDGWSTERYVCQLRHAHMRTAVKSRDREA